MAESDVETQAAKFKEEGNTFFKAFQFPKAIDAYTKCLELDDKNVAVYCNRAFAHLKVEAFGSALEDANVAIDLDPAFVKAYYRRATAYLALGKNEEALKDLKRVVTIVPKDKDAKLKYQSCEKQVKQMRFAKAIESEETQPVSQTIKLDDIVVSDSYAGPRLEGDITKEFVLELMSHLKEQKSLHKKYPCARLLSWCVQTGVDAWTNWFPPFSDVPDDKTITVCGDIHGQYYDLMNIFENLNGLLPSEENPYLFNGDFVDRGSFSLECILVLLCWKVLLPNHFFMSRQAILKEVRRKGRRAHE